MIRRTSVEIDDQLLERAKWAPGSPTTRATIEEAKRRAAEQAEDEQAERVARLRDYLETLSRRVDLAVLALEEMWR
jgi:Arc/MetJ family transcription regulator